MVTRIVVPLDGSQLSHRALPMARSLAEIAGAGVTLVSVIDPPRDFHIVSQESSTSRWRSKDIDHFADEEKRLQQYLDQIGTTFETSTVTTDIRLGEAAEEILRSAEMVDGSAIVIATHGRSGIGRALMGTVAGRIVQTASVPVFVVRANDDKRTEFGKQPINHVTVALDGSVIAERALDRAYGLFGNDVRYTLVRIIEPIAPGQAYNSESIAHYEREAREYAEEYLGTIVDRLTERGATVSADVRVTQPATGITRVADEFGANLVVMSTHGRGGFGRFLLGSVAERVLHQAEQPVMIVRGVEPEE